MYRFFGDSHTVGQGAKYTSRSYVSLVLNHLGNPSFVNLAAGGNMAWDCSQAIFASNVISSDTSFYLIGTNDERVYDESLAGVEAFTNCIESEYAWLGTTSKFSGLSNFVTYTGSWINSTITGIGKRTTGNTTGDKASFNLTGKTIYIGTVQTPNLSGTADVFVDGVLTTNINTYANVPLTLNGYSHGANLIRIDGLTDAPHLVEIVCTSGYVYFEWAGVPEFGPKVYAISPFRKAPDGYERTGGSEYGLRQMWQATKDAAALLMADGMNINWIDTYSTINAPADTITDDVHLSDYGHRVLAEKIISSLNY